MLSHCPEKKGRIDTELTEIKERDMWDACRKPGKRRPRYCNHWKGRIDTELTEEYMRGNHRNICQRFPL